MRTNGMAEANAVPFGKYQVVALEKLAEINRRAAAK
jgi:hypothetical protein